MRRIACSVLALLLGAVWTVTSAAPSEASCIFDCYQFTSSSSNIYAVSSKDCDSCTPYAVWPGRNSHIVTGGIPFYVPAGCVAKTSFWGSYWAYNGWHWFPHHTGTVTMRPAESWRTDC